MRKLLVEIYLFIFGRPGMQFVNNAIIRLVLHARGYNNYENPKKTGELRFLKMLAKISPSICIDVGANKGNFSKMLLEETNSVVYAFEPLPKAFDHLMSLESIYKNRFHPVKAGVGSSSGHLDIFFDSPDSELASFSREVNESNCVAERNKNFINVPVVTLDSFFYNSGFNNLQSIDFIKIDTEGFEFEVLLGAQKVIETFKPKFIQIEFNWHHLFRGHTLKSISTLLSGYDTYQLLPYGKGLCKRDVNSPESNIFLYTNFVFVRSDFQY